MPNVLVRGVSQHVHLGAIGPDNHAVCIYPVHRLGGILNEVVELLPALAQLFFYALSSLNLELQRCGPLLQPRDHSEALVRADEGTVVLGWNDSGMRAANGMKPPAQRL